MKKDLVKNRAIVSLVFLLATNQSVAERMNKCVDEKGAVTFTTTDCPKNETRHRVFVVPPKRGTGAGLRDSELRAIGFSGKSMGDRQATIEYLTKKLKADKLTADGLKQLTRLFESGADKGEEEAFFENKRATIEYLTKKLKADKLTAPGLKQLTRLIESGAGMPSSYDEQTPASSKNPGFDWVKEAEDPEKKWMREEEKRHEVERRFRREKKLQDLGIGEGREPNFRRALKDCKSVVGAFCK